MSKTGQGSDGTQASNNLCQQCGRENLYCVCDLVSPITTRTKVLILQHPQEPGVDIGTVPIIRALLPQTVIKTGLSWPNITKALGHETTPNRWGVLYVGSVQVDQLPGDRSLFVVDKKGSPIKEQDATLSELEGVVLLDGTWSQAKTLWWRNAWLLKLKRLVIRPDQRSRYDRIRREPRKGCLSTLETVGEVIKTLDQRHEITELIERPLTELVNRLADARSGARGSGKRFPRRHGRS